MHWHTASRWILKPESSCDRAGCRALGNSWLWWAKEKKIPSERWMLDEKSDNPGRADHIFYLWILAPWVYLWSSQNHAANLKTQLYNNKKKSLFKVSEHYTTSPIYGLGEATWLNYTSPLIQVGCYRLSVCGGFNCQLASMRLLMA